MRTYSFLVCLLVSTFIASFANAQPTSDPAEEMRQRITAKVESVKQGVQAWAASGRDPLAMVKTMQETIKPLLDAGRAAEAEAALDRMLEQLKVRLLRAGIENVRVSRPRVMRLSKRQPVRRKSRHSTVSSA